MLLANKSQSAFVTYSSEKRPLSHKSQSREHTVQSHCHAWIMHISDSLAQNAWLVRIAYECNGTCLQRIASHVHLTPASNNSDAGPVFD